jgi:hypothetical protein
VQADGTRDMPCGFGHLTMNSDQVYDNGYAWSDCANQPPDWGAFAESFTATPDLELCALVFDLTTVRDVHLYTMDAYVWDDAEGTPGNVLGVVTGYDPYPIAQWPEFSRHSVELTLPVTGRFWIGEWGSWSNIHDWEWYIAADGDAAVEGTPMTKIHPCTGLPSGWQDVDAMFNYQWNTESLGIGYYGHRAPTSGTPQEPAPVSGETASWGKVKELYR